MNAPQIILDTARMTDVFDSAIKADLQHLRNRYFVSLLVSTAIVGIGLLLELPEIAHDMWGIWKNKSIELKYWLSPSMDRKKYRVPDWMKTCTAVGWLLIVLGVAGEGIFEGYVSWADGTFQVFNDILLTDAQRQTDLAKERAGGAYERAATAEAESAQLRKDTESLKSENLKLEAQINPRHLDLDQQVKIAGNCAPFKSLSRENV